MAGARRRVGSRRKQAGDDRPRDRAITVLLVDARPWTREALSRALEMASRDLRVLRFADPAELAQAGHEGGPSLVLLNVTGVRLSDDHARSALSAAAAALPGTPVVALSDQDSAEEILGAIDRGLRGYIPISLELRSVVETLRFVAAGGVFVPAEPLLASLRATATPEAAGTEPPPQAAAPALPVNDLTPRELAVLALVGQGKSNKHVARELDLSEATVKVHVRHIMRKLGAVNRTQVALLSENLLR